MPGQGSLMPKIRHLHKLVAELANRKPMEKILGERDHSGEFAPRILV